MTRAAVAEHRTQRRAQAHAATRGAILEAARRVAARDGEVSLRGVAAEAGFAPAALYGYFSGKDDLLLALAAEDLTQLARAMREAAPGEARLAEAAGAAVALLGTSESLAASVAALPAEPGHGEAERLFNGRLIAVLKALSDASGRPAADRAGQCDVVLLAAAVAGLALFARTGRLTALGFDAGEILARFETHFGR